MIFLSLILSSVLLNSILCNSTDSRFVVVFDDLGIPEIVDTLAALPDVFVDNSGIKLFLYTINNPTTSENLTLNVSDIASSKYFESNRTNVFLIHGWHNYYYSDFNTYVRDAYIGVLDVNLFVIDWSTYSSGLYTVAYASIPSVGKLIGKFFGNMQSTFDLDSKDFLVVGHSLGAHVAGCAGAAVDSNIDIIVGLDPAGILYLNLIKSNRLNAADAKFVQAIHTSAGIEGYGATVGDADYRPNGGTVQNGCGLDLLKTCAHGRAYYYFAESVAKGGFTSWSCSTYLQFKLGMCSNNSKSYLGGKVIDTSVKGNYFLDTNAEYLYSKS